MAAVVLQLTGGLMVFLCVCVSLQGLITDVVFVSNLIKGNTFRVGAYT